ncbi:hypothetical protein NQ176_g8489 [Zarea fungicola]|uniref:Uncharacterized protein n=1 Tax=Zarea fungicola TaxID=93591 RepID=A0ACC1MRY5_9HYPO|nr:hypothetical protein NQ176_g8489 [Lecanicillium fungicola]
MFSSQVKLMSLALLPALAVNAEPIPVVEARAIIPGWSCPGPSEGQADFNLATADMEALAVAIQTNTLSSGTLDDSILIKGTHGIVITAGSVQVCVQNNYLFENARYARTDIALIVAQAMYNCCGGQANLQATCNAKPWATITGDTGLQAIATVGAAGDPCKGAPTIADYLDDAQIVYKTGKFFWDVFAPLLTGNP